MTNKVFWGTFFPGPYGRRWPLITSTAISTIGSVTAGFKNIETLITGRLLQGIGSGGILILTEIIICDLLPLRGG